MGSICWIKSRRGVISHRAPYNPDRTRDKAIVARSWSLFSAALAEPDRKNDLVPYWLYSVSGGAHIERHLPLLPMSRDRQLFPSLKHSLAVYRMVFGQPRQDDLLDYLSKHLSVAELSRKMVDLRIDLSPSAEEVQGIQGTGDGHPAGNRVVEKKQAT